MGSEPPLILAFDTAAAHCAAALVCGDRVLAHGFEAMERGQAERLLPMIEALLAEAGVGWGDLDGIGVCTGPGNFTGLRVAVAAARGLALALAHPGGRRVAARGARRRARARGRDASPTSAAASSRLFTRRASAAGPEPAGRSGRRCPTGPVIDGTDRPLRSRRPARPSPPGGSTGRAAAGAALPAPGGRDAAVGGAAPHPR